MISVQAVRRSILKEYLWPCQENFCICSPLISCNACWIICCILLICNLICKSDISVWTSLKCQIPSLNFFLFPGKYNFTSARLKVWHLLTTSIIYKGYLWSCYCHSSVSILNRCSDLWRKSCGLRLRSGCADGQMCTRMRERRCPENWIRLASTSQAPEAKNNRKIESRRKRRRRVIARSPVKESVETWHGSFSPAQKFHTPLPPHSYTWPQPQRWRGGYGRWRRRRMTHRRTPKHSFLSRQAVTARQER